MTEAASQRPYGRRQARPAGSDGPGGDAGFTLVEMLVALSLVGLVSAFAISFHVSSLSATRTEANRQVAAQMVSEALDSARKAGGAAVLASPAVPPPVTVNNVRYTQQWTVCRQTDPGSACVARSVAPGIAELVRVVVTVEWTEGDKARSEHGAALISTAAVDPTFVS